MKNNKNTKKQKILKDKKWNNNKRKKNIVEIRLGEFRVLI